MDKIIKQAYKLKEYTFPSGKIEEVQGYEHYASIDLFLDKSRGKLLSMKYV